MLPDDGRTISRNVALLNLFVHNVVNLLYQVRILLICLRFILLYPIIYKTGVYQMWVYIKYDIYQIWAYQVHTPS